MNQQSFTPANELTFETVQLDIGRLGKLLNEGHLEVLYFNLHNVMYCDSAGLALLIEAKRLCKKQNTRLELQGISKSILALAEFCGVATMLSQVH